MNRVIVTHDSTLARTIALSFDGIKPKKTLPENSLHVYVNPEESEDAAVALTLNFDYDTHDHDIPFEKKLPLSTLLKLCVIDFNSFLDEVADQNFVYLYQIGLESAIESLGHLRFMPDPSNREMIVARLEIGNHYAYAYLDRKLGAEIFDRV